MEQIQSSVLETPSRAVTTANKGDTLPNRRRIISDTFQGLPNFPEWRGSCSHET